MAFLRRRFFAQPEALEDSPPAGPASGMIERNRPQTWLAALAVESEGEDRWLVVTLRLRGDEESWRTLFQPAAEPALRTLVELAAL